MSLIRKVLWPSAIALGFLMFLAAIGGPGTATVRADEGEICAIEGPTVIAEGQTVLYVAFIETDEDEDAEHNYAAEIDNVSGRSFITSAVDDDGEYDTLGPTTEVNDLEPIDIFDVLSDDEDLFDTGDLAELRDIDPEFELPFNACGTATNVAVARIINDGIAEGEVCVPPIDGTSECPVNRPGTFDGSLDIDCPSGLTCTIPAAVVTAVVNSIIADLTAGNLDCDDIALNAQKAAVGAGAHVLVADQIQDFVEEICDEDFEVFDDAFLDAALIIDVTCEEAGEFTLSFFDMEEDDDAMSIDVTCLGEADASSTITARPTVVEIVPAPGNVSHSLITVTLLSDGDMAAAGGEVDFTTTRCSIETSGVDTAAEFAAASAVFGAFSANVPATATAIEASAAATAAVDSTPTSDSTVAFFNAAGTATIAAAILGCSPADIANATPGPAVITAVIEVEGGADIIETVTVTVIGPPASLTVSANPTTLRCGEKAEIIATVKDAIGQNVSPHTQVEAVTNFGGVLGGTGAVSAELGLVTPLSSTVAEVFDGQAKFFLLTSEQHSGPYEVVVTAGGTFGGGVFSTAPISAQVTVICTLPTTAAPGGGTTPSGTTPSGTTPSTTSPGTGTGTITPPRTGDAGLAENNGLPVLMLLGGVAAFVLAGVAGVKFARR